MKLKNGFILIFSVLASICLTLSPSAQPTASDERIRFYQVRITKDPEDAFNYHKLGGAYIQKARESGDVTYYSLGEEALKKSLNLAPEPSIATSATASLAIIYLSKHQFKDALAYGQKAIGMSGRDLYPYVIIGDAYIELGHYDKAAEAYAKMGDISGPLRPYSRLSYLQFLKGDTNSALDQMQRGLTATLEANGPSENIAWNHVQRGDLFFYAGNIPAAEKSFRDALAVFPRYHRGLAGLARAQAAQKNYPAAVGSYQNAIGIIPLPEYAAALGDVYTKIGRTADAKKQYDLVEYIGYLNTLNKQIYNRELALFYADHDMKLAMADELARKELEARGDIYTYDVLAWCLYKNGKGREALEAMTEALKLGTNDARLFFHAGMIHHGLGNAEKAREYLGRALATNSHFHVLQADVAAQTLKQLEAR